MASLAASAKALMTGKRWRMCGRKHRYRNADQASRAADRLKLRAYRCPFCQAWHLTKQLRGQEPGITKTMKPAA